MLNLVIRMTTGSANYLSELPEGLVLPLPPYCLVVFPCYDTRTLFSVSRGQRTVGALGRLDRLSFAYWGGFPNAQVSRPVSEKTDWPGTQQLSTSERI